ncbi:Predicted Zn-dependent peptidase [Saccharicrinis carchari]|uniref:Predicted Zn-dependent peptidase n=1 Tax=Saccharicrinis carchari TaxID=1168039 RepID=A0A521EQT9_SACCC|nr:pitrilysin family protein [Saccharicrinis carchari]SMO86288.1 Predicted Zn-dependent peptidase [Saccharicrinis carchari]
MEFFTHTLDNGIRIIHKPEAGEVSYSGIIINAGSRDEEEHEHGMAHFIEHVVFKGTLKRRAFHVLSRLEDVGGELNAYTTKEETCIYATFLKEDYQRSMELIADITFHSTFPEKELVKEKEVIMDEINSYKDSPADLIFDDFEELLYPNHPIGRNILGTPEMLKTFTRKDIYRFIQNNYHTDQMVYCSVGQQDFKRVVKLAEKYFGSIPENKRQVKRSPIAKSEPKVVVIDKETYQSHIMLGGIAYDYNHPKRLGLHLLNNLLGGPGMNSRLNMSLREKKGIAYNIESSYSAFYGTGVFSVYLGTDRKNVDKSLKIVYAELNKLRNNSLGSMQLHKAKKQLKGQIAISSENKESLMLNIGKSFLLYNKVDSLPHIYNKIDELSASDLLHIANECMNPDNMSQLIYL